MSKNLDVKKLKEVLRKYYDFFIEHPELRIKEEFLSIAAINPFIRYNSSPRGLMMSNHVAQLLVLDEPDLPIIQTNINREMGKYAVTKYLKNGGKVIAVHKRYREFDTGVNFVSEYVIIYRDLETNEVESISIPYFNKFAPEFGFKFNIDKDYIESLTQGDIIPPNRLLAWPNTVMPDETMDINNIDYGYGKLLNVALMTIDEVGEDGYVISESAAKKLGFKLFQTRKINVGEERIPLNIYGDDENYKPFPELGEKTSDDSILTAVRIINDEQNEFGYDKKYNPNIPVLMTKKALQRPDTMFDNVYYLEQPNGTVVDIKVYYSPKRKAYLPKYTDEMFKRYSKALLNFYKGILNTYDRLNQPHKQRTGSDLVVGFNLNNLLVEARNIVESSYFKAKVSKNYKKEKMDIYNATFDVMFDITPTRGFKLTDHHGTKGIIVQVWPDEWMPVDKDGNRAEVIADPSSTVSRLNIGRLYERFVNASSRKAKKLVIDEIKRITNKRKIDRDVVEELSGNELRTVFDILVRYYAIFANEMYEHYKNAKKANDLEFMREAVIEAVEKEVYVYYTVEDEKKAYEVSLDILDSEFAPVYDSVTYKKNNRTHKTKSPVLIAPVYMMLLNKIGNDLLTCPSAKVNTFMLPISPSREEKDKSPHNNNPVKFTGETEIRIMASYAGREATAEIKSRGADIKTHKAVYKSILDADKPTDIKMCVDRRKYPYGKEMALQILDTIYNSVGMGLKFEEDKRRYIDPNYQKIKRIIDIDDLEETKDLDATDIGDKTKKS